MSAYTTCTAFENPEANSVLLKAAQDLGEHGIVTIIPEPVLILKVILMPVAILKSYLMSGTGQIISRQNQRFLDICNMSLTSSTW